MKKVLSLASALCISSMPVLAGGLADPIMDGIVIDQAPTNGDSEGNVVVAGGVLGATLLAVFLSSSSSTTTTTTTN